MYSQLYATSSIILKGFAHPYTSPLDTSNSHVSNDACGSIGAIVVFMTACLKIPQCMSDLAIYTRSLHDGHDNIIYNHQYIF